MEIYLQEYFDGCREDVMEGTDSNPAIFFGTVIENSGEWPNVNKTIENFLSWKKWGKLNIYVNGSSPTLYRGIASNDAISLFPETWSFDSSHFPY